MVLQQRTLSIRILFLTILFSSSHDHGANAFFVSITKTGNGLLPASHLSFPTTTTTTTTTTTLPHHWKGSSIHMIPHVIDTSLLTDTMATSAFHLSAVEVFDGSSIVDPVVVSSNFWSSLQRQLLSVILGQLIASVVFAILVTVLAPQLVIVRDMVIAKITNINNDGNDNATPSKTFIKADSIVRPAPDFGKLLICLLVDIIGTSSEALPVVGELTDILTAPVLGFILQNLYPGSSKFVFFFEFAEEILPLTDFIPFATICWAVDTYFPESTIAELFQLGNYNDSVVTTAEKVESFDASSERINQDSDNNSYR